MQILGLDESSYLILRLIVHEEDNEKKVSK